MKGETMGKSSFEDVVGVALYNWVCGIYELPQNADRFCISYWQEKPVIKTNGNHGRLDFCITVCDPEEPETNRAKFNIEAKTCATDLNSPYGKNWNQVGWNYVIYPRDAFKYAIYGAQMDAEYLGDWLDAHGYNYVGILAYEKDGSITCERKAKRLITIESG
jgi:hypothetical protein